MTTSILALCLTAASIGAFHTLIGPDHYLPFVFMSRAGGWSRTKTLVITLLCGVGHVLSSVMLGAIGIAIGLAMARVEAIEAARGHVASWALIAFGLVYGVWGLRRALRNREHEHTHVHADGTVHSHPHTHHDEHAHVHGDGKTMTPWVLFTIFVFGPCEPLIPLVMVPAAQHSTWGVLVVTVIFGVATLATMTVMVLLCSAGAARVKLGTLERYNHALAGAALAACGIAIRVLGV